LAVTPFNKLSSEDILSAHINALAKSINKLEEALEPTLENRTFFLSPVSDQKDLSLRYRIYESEFVGWTNYSITRDGQPIPDDEYIAQPAFGVIVFNTPQSDMSVVEVTAELVSKVSDRINFVESSISTLSDDISQVQAGISDLDTAVETVNSDLNALSLDVQELSNRPSGSISLPLVRDERSLFTNLKPSVQLSEMVDSPNILMAAGKMDSIPLIIENDVVIKSIQMVGGTSTVGGNALMGIYSDNQLCPGELLSDTAVFQMRSGVITETLKEPVTLKPGLYWITRWGEGGIRVDGYTYDPARHITFEEVASGYMDGSGPIVGVRSVSFSGLTGLPKIFPQVGFSTSDSSYLSRQYVGAMYAIR
jgi:hypothetical protein